LRFILQEKLKENIALGIEGKRGPEDLRIYGVRRPDKRMGGPEGKGRTRREHSYPRLGRASSLMTIGENFFQELVKGKAGTRAPGIEP